MSRVKRGFKARRRRNKVLDLAKGYRGSRSVRIKTAFHLVKNALAYSFRDRRAKKRDFRRLWIQRINAACRERGMKYSEFIFALQKNDISFDRKVLSEIAYKDPVYFDAILAKVKKV